ncbi:MAG: Ty1/Copia family ribonuclease HI, partial [Gaiellaceae bacterium]
PIRWYTKKQNTIETSTYGSEFVALRIAVELIEGLRYKIRMLGVPLLGPANGFCDNQSVVINSTWPDSTLKKKHNSISYHKVRECIAAKIIRLAKEDGTTNLADILTKSLSAPRAKFLCARIMY